MPIGTVARHTERFELTTLQDAYVIIRRMNYGEKLERQEDLLNMRTTGENNQFEFKMMSKKLAFRDFANLVIEHNITDENDRLLNFKNPNDVLQLDVKVGEEIGNLIDKLNTFEEKVETKN